MQKENIAALTWFLPEERSRSMVTVRDRHTLYFGLHLLPQLPERVVIGVEEGGAVICLREDERGLVVDRRNGAVRWRWDKLIAHLVEQGVRLPARYRVTREGDMWLGRLEVRDEPIFDEKKLAKAGRMREMSGLLAEVMRR